MGTRGAWGFKLDQKEVIFYNHFDSYPDGLGQTIVDYVNTTQDWNSVRDSVWDFHIVSDNDVPTKEQKSRARELGTVDLNVSRKSEDDWYCLTRNAQGDMALTLELGFGQTDSDFLSDSLFCEYAYIINLDTMEIEIYTGFNKDFNAEGRYANRAEVFDTEIRQSYAGVKLVGTFPLDNIPEDWIDICYPEEEEE